jgi:hypothetical protein
MADPNPALRKEMMDAMASLDPQIRGLENAMKALISPELQNALGTQLGMRQQRRELLKRVVVALDGVVEASDALDKNGYPTFPAASLSADLQKEYDEYLASISAGGTVFTKPTVSARAVPRSSDKASS